MRRTVLRFPPPPASLEPTRAAHSDGTKPCEGVGGARRLCRASSANSEARSARPGGSRACPCNRLPEPTVLLALCALCVGVERRGPVAVVVEQPQSQGAGGVPSAPGGAAPDPRQARAHGLGGRQLLAQLEQELGEPEVAQAATARRDPPGQPTRGRAVQRDRRRAPAARAHATRRRAAPRLEPRPRPPPRCLRQSASSSPQRIHGLAPHTAGWPNSASAANAASATSSAATARAEADSKAATALAPRSAGAS